MAFLTPEAAGVLPPKKEVQASLGSNGRQRPRRTIPLDAALLVHEAPKA
jgi:hypothetical protein